MKTSLPMAAAPAAPRCDAALVHKYNQPGPRYTSYPTVPYWDAATFSVEGFLSRLDHALARGVPIALYVHLPYCESLCTFCGCNRRITKKHDVEGPYIDAVLAEWHLVAGDKRGLRLGELHFGGGTPSFFSPDNLARLVDGLCGGAMWAADQPTPDFAFEGHPNNTTREHLATLAARGFRRVSFGVQDYDPVVQEAIHRIQPVEHVQRVTAWARELGYTSVNHDLVYGLPKQTAASLRHTVEQTLTMMPERIAFYSYAHVPWIGNTGQRGFSDEDLPGPEQKAEYAALGRELFLTAGYVAVGMDHYARPDDELARAQAAGALHRNFMGYTARRSEVLLGLGTSSISDCGDAFAQNEREVEGYMAAVAAGKSPITRGHLLTAADVRVRGHILQIMCQGKLPWREAQENARLRGCSPEEQQAQLQALAADGLVALTDEAVVVTTLGRDFLRNVCMVFDVRLHTQDQAARFSQTV